MAIKLPSDYVRSYYASSYTGTVTGPWTPVAMTVQVTRVGNMVILSWPGFGVVTGNATSIATFSVTLDVQFRSAFNRQAVVMGVVNNTSVAIIAQISTLGVLTWYTLPSFGSFTSGQLNAISSGGISYII